MEHDTLPTATITEKSEESQEAQRSKRLSEIDQKNVPTLGARKRNNDGDTKLQAHKYGTRGARYGRAADSYDKYNMSFHPADVNLRPKRAAKRRSVPRSVSAVTLDKVVEQTEEESQPSAARESASPAASDDEQSDDEQSDDEALNNHRRRGPLGTRRSKRAQARKPVNYSTKHHKDDDRIPGFQHRAKQLKRDVVTTSRRPPVEKNTSVKKPYSTKAVSSLVPIPQSDDVDKLVEDALSSLSQIPSSRAHGASERPLQRHGIIGIEGSMSDDPSDGPDAGAQEAEACSLSNSTTLCEDNEESALPKPLWAALDDTDREVLGPSPMNSEPAHSTTQNEQHIITSRRERSPKDAEGGRAYEASVAATTSSPSLSDAFHVSEVARHITVQAILEQALATTQPSVPNSSSSDMLL